MTMNVKHTPGPWHVELKTHILDANRTLIANVCDRYDGTNNNFLSSAEANARLIAAAPELLEALRDLVDVMTGRMNGETVALHNALVTITKATGENQ